MKQMIWLVFITALFAACEKKDSAELFGYTYIYIPQSTVSGGTNLNYLVPTGNDVNTFNYVIDSANNKVNVLLGVSRSGKETAEGYSVNVAARTDTITQLIANGLIQVAPNQTKPVELLPASAYTLPQTVAVPGGQITASFNLSINRTILKTYAGKKVALGVVISNPTKYQLSATNNQVVIIIDVDNLR